MSDFTITLGLTRAAWKTDYDAWGTETDPVITLDMVTFHCICCEIIFSPTSDSNRYLLSEVGTNTSALSSLALAHTCTVQTNGSESAFEERKREGESNNGRDMKAQIE